MAWRAVNGKPFLTTQNDFFRHWERKRLDKLLTGFPRIKMRVLLQPSTRDGISHERPGRAVVREKRVRSIRFELRLIMHVLATAGHHQEEATKDDSS
jgi:hypothetical protein